MRALIDADILRYEIGFGAETIHRGTNGADVDYAAPWYMVQDLLDYRIEEIMHATQATEFQLYLTVGDTFRYQLAKTKPYKGNRSENKPWHFVNLTSHMIHILRAEAVMNIEADDRLSIEHLADKDTVLCSRDKDLRQVPGLFFSWELGRQPSFGPLEVPEEGWLEWNGNKLNGCGYKFFCAQMLMGDRTDNIPGLPKFGPVAAYEFLKDVDTKEEMYERVEDAYRASEHIDDWEEYLLEQGRLCWITRRLNPDGSPELWELGMT